MPDAPGRRAASSITTKRSPPGSREFATRSNAVRRRTADPGRSQPGRAGTDPAAVFSTSPTTRSKDFVAARQERLPLDEPENKPKGRWQDAGRPMPGRQLPVFARPQMAKLELAKSFEPADIERRWYRNGKRTATLSPVSTPSNPNAFCILLPPPNVTGTLHMGHGFNQAIMDALTRTIRDAGRTPLWQPGTDHAGIATQIVVDASSMRRAFAATTSAARSSSKVWEWKEYSGNTITRQMRRLGTSDWTRERFTMDEGLSKIVTETFVRLYKEGLIYRGKRLVNWDPKLHTAVSDLEVVERRKKTASVAHPLSPLADGSAVWT